MKVEEARIVAHVCGDGCIGKYLDKNALQIVNGRRYHRGRIKYTIGYCNNEETLLEQFKNDMKKIYGLNARRSKNNLTSKSKRVFDRLKSLGAGNSREWFIGKEILKSNKKVKAAWLRAFFDDEASSGLYSGRIKIKSVNLKGLNIVCKLLKDLNIHSNITGPNIDNTWYLNLRRDATINYYKQIGFSHPYKMNKLRDYVRDYLLSKK